MLVSRKKTPGATELVLAPIGDSYVGDGVVQEAAKLLGQTQERSLFATRPVQVVSRLLHYSDCHSKRAAPPNPRCRPKPAVAPAAVAAEGIGPWREPWVC